MCRRLAVGTVTLAALLAASAMLSAVTSPTQQMPSGMGMGSDNLTPTVKGLYNGQEILFIHTEASDPKVAGLLTRMMGPKVVLVPSLGKIPSSLLADVYVFTNGVKGSGPMGFQPDVFDAVPGDARYTPLRALNLVAWRKGTAARLLGSAAEVKAAAARGEVTITRPGVVINMPILSWPGGQR